MIFKANSVVFLIAVAIAATHSPKDESDAENFDSLDKTVAATHSPKDESDAESFESFDKRVAATHSPKDESDAKSSDSFDKTVAVSYSLKKKSKKKSFSKAYTGSLDQYFPRRFLRLAKPFKRILDGPFRISTAPIKYVSRNKLPTPKQLNYYMYYSGATYSGYGVKKLKCEYCEKFKGDVDDHKVMQDDVHNLLCLVTLSTKRKEIVIAFRGSFNIWNFFIDFAARSVGGYDYGIKIHAGFKMVTEALYDRVVGAIRHYRKNHPHYKVVLCGHSLGGAMARLTYFLLHYNKVFPSARFELYTYGEPRGGNKAYSNYMNKRSITTARVVARADIVPHVPPTSFFGTKILFNDNYVHPHTEYWINGKKDQRFCSRTVYEDPKCSMSIGPLFSIFDHLMYFDVDLAASMAQPLQTLQLPFNIFNPLDRLPPLPKGIAKIFGRTAKSINRFINPIFG